MNDDVPPRLVPPAPNTAYAYGRFHDNAQALALYFDEAFTRVRSSKLDLSQYERVRVSVRTGYTLGIAKDMSVRMMEESTREPITRREVGWSHAW
jgi:hypothetical protein